MKLYTRGQVLFFSLLSGLIVVLFALGLGAGRPLIKANDSALQTSETKEQEFTLRQTDYTGLNTADLVPFSES